MALDIAKRRLMRSSADIPADTEVRVISVVEPPYFPQHIRWVVWTWNIYEEIEKSAREVARAAVKKAASKLREKGRKLNVTTEVLSGSPSE